VLLGNRTSALSVFALLVTLIRPAPSPAQTADILAGPVINPNNGHVYYLLSPLTWPEAESLALDFGGHLATVRNQTEQTWLWSTFNLYEGTQRSFWIGLYDPDPYVTSSDLQQRKLEFFWSSGEPVIYTNWDTFQPDFGGTVPTQSGTTMWNTAGGRWDNDFTNRLQRAVVEIVPPDAPLVWHPLRDIGAPFGSATRIFVNATGARPLSYQWQFNGQDLPQATNATLNLTPLRLFHEGTYSVRIWNSFGETREGPFAVRVGTRVELIPFGANWRFWDRAIPPDVDWAQLGFDDFQWSIGRAQLGYGDGDEVTVIQNRYITTWFRTTFAVTNPSLISGLIVRLLRDDGAIGYLNGTEIFRANITSRQVGPETFALEQTAGAAETTPSTHPFDSRLLVGGMNVLAVEVHQSEAASSDLSFDLQLQAVESLPPLRIRGVNPDNSHVFRRRVF
jgi:hypothetical protein